MPGRRHEGGENLLSPNKIDKIIIPDPRPIILFEPFLALLDHGQVADPAADPVADPVAAAGNKM